MIIWEFRIVRLLASMSFIFVLMACGVFGEKELVGKWSTDFQRIESTREVENRSTLLLYSDDTFELVLDARGDLRGDPEVMTAVGRVEWKDEDAARLIVDRWYAEGELFSEGEDGSIVIHLGLVNDLSRALLLYPDEDEKEVLYKVE